jgi:hypothetical protein
MTRLDPRRFGPWAVVTGASSGIGEAMAWQLAAAGLDLVLVARREHRLRVLAAALAGRHGTACRVVALDLAAADCLTRLRTVTDALDIGLLVSNAGVAVVAELVHRELDEVESELAVNALTHVRLGHHFGARLARRGAGGLLLVSSIAGRQPIAGLATYAAAKSFVTLLGESLHEELRPRGVTVTVLVAGPTDTPMRTAMGFGASRMRPLSPTACAREGLQALARGRSRFTPGRMISILLTVVPRSFRTRMLGRMVAGFAGGRALARASSHDRQGEAR